MSENTATETQRDGAGRFVKGARPPRGAGGQLGNGNARLHGLQTLQRAVRELGDRAIDGRSTIGKALAAWRAELVEALGGVDAVTPQQVALLDLTVKQKLLVDSLDAWLLSQRALVDEERKAVLPVLRERQAVADGLARYIAMLGLERRAKAMPSLSEYVRDRYGKPGGDAA